MKMILLPLFAAGMVFGLPNPTKYPTCEATLTFDNYTLAWAQSVIDPSPSLSFTRQTDLPDPYAAGFKINNWGVVTQVDKPSAFLPNTSPNVIGWGGQAAKFAGPALMTIIDHSISCFTPQSFWFFCSLNQYTAQVHGFPPIDCNLKVTCHKAGGHKSSQMFRSKGCGKKMPVSLTEGKFGSNMCDCDSLDFVPAVTRNDLKNSLVAVLGEKKGAARAKAMRNMDLLDTYVVAMDTFKLEKVFKGGVKKTHCGTQ